MSQQINEETVEAVRKLAHRAHFGQTRHTDEGGKPGVPYITHPESVESRVGPKVSRRILALAHDVLEDTGITEEEMIAEGFPAELMPALKALTRVSGENYYDFITRLIAFAFWADLPLPSNGYGMDTIEVKLADIADNSSDLKEGSLKDKYRFATRMLQRAKSIIEDL